MSRLVAALAAVVSSVGLFAAAPAAADVGKSHCAAPGFCLFSFTDYQGVAKAVNTVPGCHSVIPLGLPWARSAARGTPSAGDLLLFADQTCHSVFDKLTTADLPDTYALSYEVVPVSS